MTFQVALFWSLLTFYGRKDYKLGNFPAIQNWMPNELLSTDNKRLKIEHRASG